MCGGGGMSYSFVIEVAPYIHCCHSWLKGVSISETLTTISNKDISLAFVKVTLLNLLADRYKTSVK